MKYLLPLLLLSAFALAQDAKPEEKIEPTPEAKPEEKKPEESKDEAKPVAPANTNPVVIMKTSMGDIEIELFAAQAPKTVENFVGLAEGTKEFTDVKSNQKVTRPFYDGIAFHRVIDKFMVQGGCPLGTGSGSPGFKFEDEINAKGLGLDKMTAIVNGAPHKYLGIQSQQQFNQQITLIALNLNNAILKRPAGTAALLELFGQFFQFSRFQWHPADQRHALAFAAFGFTTDPHDAVTDRFRLTVATALFNRL